MQFECKYWGLAYCCFIIAFNIQQVQANPWKNVHQSNSFRQKCKALFSQTENKKLCQSRDCIKAFKLSPITAKSGPITSLLPSLGSLLSGF